MQFVSGYYFQAVYILERLAPVIPALFLRLFLAWEFGEAGYAKLTGSNWFEHVTFPFPFNLLPAEIGWQIATWFELIGAAALVLGLATRFFSVSLIILTIVAIAAVHWPSEWHSLGQLLAGYRIIDEQGDGLGNYKLPVIFLVMFLPLLFSGAGKLSLDYWICRQYFGKHTKY
ncbi:MAG: DoxX family protein [Betaproteobacteria bacterium HGW-Betaproteobacteria-1]|jgi:putative oxidoreductase|nr:MAG: DoxX family protein [Betaproteobacteria bacterium HGW-Betaproteobacteria-1]